MLTVTPFVSYSTRFCITRGTGVLLSFFAGVLLSFFAVTPFSFFAVTPFSFFAVTLFSFFAVILFSFFAVTPFSFFAVTPFSFFASASLCTAAPSSDMSSSSCIAAAHLLHGSIMGIAMGSLLSEHENSPQAPRSTMIVLSRGAIICAIVTSVCSGTCGIDTMVMTSSFGHTLACSDCATALSGEGSSVAHPPHKHPLSGNDSSFTSRSSPTEKL